MIIGVRERIQVSKNKVVGLEIGMIKITVDKDIRVVRYSRLLI